ncbi:hypothetical protein LX32DRAFT_644241 [Colletotrichum zoysiae]|uniref:Uncharacterized protein n=1 Tax=Colletotrichum zoysiae TaxID=1216348 RepID=A0AAD9LWK7_9PEZI|nr:hypothetical protein LX32DRAFT_644241 [Colletotrichum zoysiae]
MHALNLAAPVALLLQGVAAVPAPELVARADVLAPTAAWISVNDKGVPTTVTPVPTTISGTPTFASAAPNALTGSVFTLTDFRLVQVTTSTGSPPLATADSKSGAGAFAPCSNANGDFSPFCDPVKDSQLFVDGTYYVTWDPTVLIKGNKTNVHVKIQGKAVNGTTVGDVVLNDDTDKTNPAAWGYYAWNVDGSLIPSGQDNATIELLMSYTIDNIAQQDITGPRVLVVKRPQFHPQPTKIPKGAELYIALPTVFGFIVLAVIGGCLWNRSTRKIGLGNVMSRSRHGYGIGKARAQRLGARVRQSVFHGRKDRGIQLREREMDLGGDGYVYRDEPLPGQRPAGRPRRDSDSLGSLADSPTSTHFQDQDVRGAGGGGNAFREELRRQERERF